MRPRRMKAGSNIKDLEFWILVKPIQDIMISGNLCQPTHIAKTFTPPSQWIIFLRCPQILAISRWSRLTSKHSCHRLTPPIRIEYRYRIQRDFVHIRWSSTSLPSSTHTEWPWTPTSHHQNTHLNYFVTLVQQDTQIRQLCCLQLQVSCLTWSTKWLNQTAHTQWEVNLRSQIRRVIGINKRLWRLLGKQHGISRAQMPSLPSP